LRFHRFSATLFYLSSLCVCLSRLVHAFVRFRLSDQLRPSAGSINDLDVVNVANMKTWLFQKLEYYHIYRFLYFDILCY